jgi:hypothetical protein
MRMKTSKTGGVWLSFESSFWVGFCGFHAFFGTGWCPGLVDVGDENADATMQSDAMRCRTVRDL